MKIAVITGSTGHPLLSEAARSVQLQTWAANIEHWIIVDGAEYEHATRTILGKLPISKVTQHILVLPKNTGGSGYVCHRINGAVPWLVDAEYVCYLDQDNAYELDHIQKLVESIPDGGRWAHSFRKIIDRDGNDICLDSCESLGGVCHTCISAHDRLIDTNCYIINRELAIQISSLWNVKARQQGACEADRQVCGTLLRHEPLHGISRSHSVKYRVDGRSDSVSASFFLSGNEKLGAGVGGYDFANKRDIYIFHFVPNQSALYVGKPPASPLAEWCPGMWHDLCDEYNLLDGYANIEYLPLGAVCLVAMWHPDALPCDVFAKRTDLKRIVYTAESPNVRHQAQWTREFLSKHFDVALTCWEPLLQNPGPNFKTIFCPHNSRFLQFPDHTNELRSNRGACRRSVGVVLEKRNLQGTYAIDGISLRCLDPLRETYVTGLTNATVYGIGWKEFCYENPAVRLGHALERSKDPETSIDHLQKHDFGLVIENTDAYGYVSEKLGDCLIAGAIPLYYGSPSHRTPLPEHMCIDIRRFYDGAALQDHINSMTDDDITKMKYAIVAHRASYLESRGRRVVGRAVRAALETFMKKCIPN
jgi:hypothetical protein